MLVLPASPWKRWCNWQPLRFALTSVLPLSFIATLFTLALTRGVSLLGLVLGIDIGLLAPGYWSGATSLDKRPALLDKRDQLSKTLIYFTLIRYTLKEYPVHQEPLREKTAMGNFIERLYSSDESAVCYKTRVYLFDENPATPVAQELQDAIKTSERVRCLLAGRDEHGRLPSPPYSKWYGAHWVLVVLADLDYPPGDEALIPLREQVYEWLFSDSRLRSIKQYTIAGRVRMCASMEGNAIFALLKLSLADERVERLVERLLAWQWPDGGWNCDKKRQAHVSSFTETLLPLRALSLYSRSTGHQEAREASERAAEYFLRHQLFKRLSDGTLITDDFLKLFYPYYWHYNTLFGLKVLAEVGHIDDPRCREALSILDAKCLPDGGYPAEKKYYRVAEQMSNGCSPVDWGGTSTKHMNPFVTVEALSVLKRATLGR